MHGPGKVAGWEDDIQPCASGFLLSTIVQPGRSSVMTDVRPPNLSFDIIDSLTWKTSMVLG